MVIVVLIRLKYLELQRLLLEVITPICFGKSGKVFLRARSNNPAASNFFFNASKARRNLPSPRSSYASAIN